MEEVLGELMRSLLDVTHLLLFHPVHGSLLANLNLLGTQTWQIRSQISSKNITLTYNWFVHLFYYYKIFNETAIILINFHFRELARGTTAVCSSSNFCNGTPNSTHQHCVYTKIILGYILITMLKMFVQMHIWSWIFVSNAILL